GPADRRPGVNGRAGAIATAGMLATLRRRAVAPRALFVVGVFRLRLPPRRGFLLLLDGRAATIVVTAPSRGCPPGHQCESDQDNDGDESRMGHGSLRGASSASE